MGQSEAISISEVRTTPTRFSTRCRPRQTALTQVSPGATQNSREFRDSRHRKVSAVLEKAGARFPFGPSLRDGLLLLRIFLIRGRDGLARCLRCAHVDFLIGFFVEAVLRFYPGLKRKVDIQLNPLSKAVLIQLIRFLG